MEYSPPPLFKQGPSALVRLIFFVVLSLVLLVSDARFNTLEIVRGILGAGLYPLQRAALVPRDLFMGAADLAVTSSQLRSENTQLHAQNLKLAQEANLAASLSVENAHLRALLQLSQHASTQSIPVEIQYDTADPFTQKIVIGSGSQQGIHNGAPVVSEDGVVGQVTRVFPLQSEVTLLTDKDQAVPVQVLRTGLRSVIYGTPKGDSLDLRFVPISADVVAGDELVTSGLDGVYPPGLPVAKVIRVDKQADTAFARVICVPVAAVRGARQMLVLRYQTDAPPRPAEHEPASAAKDAKTKKGAKSTDKGAAKGTEKAPEKGTEKSTDKPDGKPATTGKAADAKAPPAETKPKTAEARAPTEAAGKPATARAASQPRPAQGSKP